MDIPRVFPLFRDRDVDGTVDGAVCGTARSMAGDVTIYGVYGGDVYGGIGPSNGLVGDTVVEAL